MLIKIDNIMVDIERINNDYNGNPRYKIQTDWVKDFKKLKKVANKLGFRKVRNREELIITSYNIRKDIFDLVNEYFKE